jgi:hypothetical protein
VPLDANRTRLALAVVGPGVEIEVALRGRAAWAIGRAPDNDIVVDHPSISRHHARLHTGDQFALEALAATNPLRFAGHELAPGERVTVVPGEAFALGALVGVIRPVSEPRPAAAHGSPGPPTEAPTARPAAAAEAPPEAPPAVPAAAAPAPAARSLREELADEERRRIVDALRRSGGNQSRAAELLGMPRRTLVKRLRDYRIPRGRVIPDE